MSIRYSIAKSALRVLGFKKMFQLPLNRLIIKAEHLNKNRNFQIPKNRKYIYNDIPIMNGKYHCLSKSPTTSSTGGLILPLQRGVVSARPKGRCRKHCYWSAYKAVLLESSFLDSSACSLIYFCTASSVTLPIVST